MAKEVALKRGLLTAGEIEQTTEAVAAAAPVVFALNPAQVNNNIIDYSTVESIILYKAAIAPLKTKFDLKTENLNSFLERFRMRAQAFAVPFEFAIRRGPCSNHFQFIDLHYSVGTRWFVAPQAHYQYLSY